ncbi:MAG: XRE family transcriptional regulator [Candidatus Methylumidiphilus sp.]
MNTNEHDAQHVTPAGRSVFEDLFPPDEAAELEIRAVLLNGLSHWLQDSDITEATAAQVLGIDQARIAEIKQGAINQFSLDVLVRLASRAGLHPRLELKAA